MLPLLYIPVVDVDVDVVDVVVVVVAAVAAVAAVAVVACSLLLQLTEKEI